MATVTKTLKLPFLRLNRVKAEELVRLQAHNTEVAKAILAMPKAERHKLTTRSFARIGIGSTWINQTIRKNIARTRVRRFRRLPLETSHRNWTLHGGGETWSVSFGLLRGLGKRVPIEVHTASHGECLEALLEGRARAGSLKLVQSRKGIWYACISVSLEVPDTRPTGRWIGGHRGQNIPAVAATADGPVIFGKLGRIRHIRHLYAGRRKKLQKAGKHRVPRKLGQVVSKDIVSLAKRQGAGIRLEDLSGIRQSAKQHKAREADAGQNRDDWPFCQLEQFMSYKARLAGVPGEKVPAAYTSQGCHACGRIHRRDKHACRCERCGRQAYADANAAMNIRDWEGLCCPLVPEAPADELRVSETVVQAAA